MTRYKIMLKFRFPLPIMRAVVSCLVVCCLAHGQASNFDKEIHVYGLPSLTARSGHALDVLAASLQIVFHDQEVCCGKDSALEAGVQGSDPKSLKDIASKLQGRHLLSDGRPIVVTTEYLTPNQVTADHLIYMLREKHAPLMIWNSHLYVVEGVSYVEDIDARTGRTTYVTHKFLLQDARFSDSRREIAFDRLTEDSGNVQGLLFVQATPQ